MQDLYRLWHRDPQSSSDVDEIVAGCEAKLNKTRASTIPSFLMVATSRDDERLFSGKLFFLTVHAVFLKVFLAQRRFEIS